MSNLTTILGLGGGTPPVYIDLESKKGILSTTSYIDILPYRVGKGVVDISILPYEANTSIHPRLRVTVDGGTPILLDDYMSAMTGNSGDDYNVVSDLPYNTSIHVEAKAQGTNSMYFYYVRLAHKIES